MKRLLFLFAFAISMAFTAQAENTIKIEKDFEVYETFDVFVASVNFEVTSTDVIHFETQNSINYENIETSIYSNAPDVDNYINNYFLQNYQAIYKQIDHYNKGFDNYSSQDNRYLDSFTKSRYGETESYDRQINSRSNCKEIEIRKTNHQKSWQYDRSRMYIRRAEGAIGITKRDNKPLQRDKYREGRYYNYSKAIHTQNNKNISMDWWSNITTHSNWTYPKIC
jgi:hypothetical protein